MSSKTRLRATIVFAFILLVGCSLPVLAQQSGVPAQVWSLKGNANTGPNAFLGTTDSTDLRLGANGEVSFYILANGKVQVGSPESPKGFDVWGDLFVSGTTTGLLGAEFGKPEGYLQVDSTGLLQLFGTGNYGVRAGRYVYQTLNGGALTGIGLRNSASGDALELINGSASTVLSVDYATGDLSTDGDVQIGGSANVTDSLIAGAGRIAGTLGVAGPNPDPGNYALYVNGRLRTAGINELSDVRMKRNVRTIDGGLEAVLGMRGVAYEWRREEHSSPALPPGTQIGLIAQEVEEVVPEVVHTDAEGVKTIEYAHLVAVLIEAVKEQQTQIERQAQEIATMRSELGGIRDLAATR